MMFCGPCINANFNSFWCVWVVQVTLCMITIYLAVHALREELLNTLAMVLWHFSSRGPDLYFSQWVPSLRIGAGPETEQEIMNIIRSSASTHYSFILDMHIFYSIQWEILFVAVHFFSPRNTLFYSLFPQFRISGCQSALLFST